MDVRSRLNSQQQLYLDLAQSHFAHDLQQSDRDALTKAAGKAQTHVLVGGLVGSALGLGLAWRGRIGIHRAFQAIKQAPKPAEVIMESGEHGSYPFTRLARWNKKKRKPNWYPWHDQFGSPKMRSKDNSLNPARSPLSFPLSFSPPSGYVHSIHSLNSLTALSSPHPDFVFCSTGQLLFGTNIALLTGASSARSIITKEADVDRLKAAYRGFRIDLLKKELDSLERGEDVDSSLGLGPFGV